MSGRCRGCKHWIPPFVIFGAPHDEILGTCLSTKIMEARAPGEPATANEAVYDSGRSGRHCENEEDPAFWTGPDFGCVHFEGRTDG